MYCLYYFVVTCLSIIGRLVGVLGGSGFLHCLVGWLGVTAGCSYGRVFFVRCIRWPLQVNRNDQSVNDDYNRKYYYTEIHAKYGRYYERNAKRFIIH